MHPLFCLVGPPISKRMVFLGNYKVCYGKLRNTRQILPQDDAPKLTHTHNYENIGIRMVSVSVNSSSSNPHHQQLTAGPRCLVAWSWPAGMHPMAQCWNSRRQWCEIHLAAAQPPKTVHLVYQGPSIGLLENIIEHMQKKNDDNKKDTICPTKKHDCSRFLSQLIALDLGWICQKAVAFFVWVSGGTRN